MTGAAAVFGPMPGIASRLSQASSPASASPMSPSGSATSEPGALRLRVGLERDGAEPVLRPGPGRDGALALRRRRPQRPGGGVLRGDRPERPRHAHGGAGDDLGVDRFGLGDAGHHVARPLLGVAGRVGAPAPQRVRPGRDERADVALLVDDDRRGVPGALRQPVYRVRPVVGVGPEDDPAGGVERAGAVPALADVDPRVGRRPVLLRCDHGASSPLSRPEAAEATPALPGRGVARPAHLYQSFPRRRTRPGGNAPPALGDRSGRGRTAIRGGRSATIGTARSYPRISSMDTGLKERAALADDSNCNGRYRRAPCAPRGHLLKERHLTSSEIEDASVLCMHVV